MPGRSNWVWDETLFAGSAEYYERGRMPYPQALADALRDELALDGTGRLLDVGCGPGSLTKLLAPLFAEALGVDADADMVRVAARDAPPNARFVHLRAEELPSGLGTFRLATIAQALHWMEGERVVRTLRDMLEPGGAFALVGAHTQAGEGDVPRDEIAALIERYLGPGRRAGRGYIPETGRRDAREQVEHFGFAKPTEIVVPRDETFVRSEDDIVASVYSASFSAPHLFGDRRDAFEEELRALLRRAAPDGRFHERVGDVDLLVWRPA